MALFSLLVAIMVERLKLLPAAWQLESILALYTKQLFGRRQLTSDVMMALALLFPAIVVQVLIWSVNGVMFGFLSLLVWVCVAILCFSHLSQRKTFKRYMQAACRGDRQACYRFADALDPHHSLEAVSEQDLGAKVGQTVAWINYRFYGAVALFLILLGPAGAVFYCSVRYFTDLAKAQNEPLPLVAKLLAVLDWLPSRLFAFGYVLSGQFSNANGVWLRHGLNWRTDAKTIITEVAIAAEPVSETSNAPVCVQSTLSLLLLSKRNFILLVTILSLLTIFGVVL
ncbi:beta-lactamase regulator AmpE [Shewanella waksmanii]|uniref:beta-lactamase regulator AmpE n=1 Tax=Shewanella waksmanii TaxID=213783 RepID=UPI0037366F0A